MNWVLHFVVLLLVATHWLPVIRHRECCASPAGQKIWQRLLWAALLVTLSSGVLVVGGHFFSDGSLRFLLAGILLLLLMITGILMSATAGWELDRAGR